MTSPTETANILQLRQLDVNLQTDSGLASAVRALSLTIDQGQTFALVGESGCGKSMTALAMLRLLPDNASISSGQMRMGSQDLFALTELEMQSVRGRRISIIFQEPATSLNPVMTIGAQLLEVVYQHTESRGDTAKKRCIEWLTRVGLPEPLRRFDNYPFQLSGGQLQRVMIAMALAAEPDLLIADEPTTALDVTIQAQILHLLKSLQNERGMAMLLITHDLAVVSNTADHVALMYAGDIVEVAPVGAFFKHPHHPYAKLLIQALPGRQNRDMTLAAIPGTVPSIQEKMPGCRFAPRCPWRVTDCSQTGLHLTEVTPQHGVRCHQIQEVQSQPLNYHPAQVTTNPEHLKSVDAGPLLSVKNLQVRYQTGNAIWRQAVFFEAVRGVSFDIKPGQTLALVGESGCGKTTIGKALLQLLGSKAQVQGQALLRNQDVFAMRHTALRQARQQIQIIFQNPFASLNPRLRILEILEEGMVSLRPEWSRDQRQAILHDLMAKVGLRLDSLDRYPHEFSGGQRQRIAIARALAVQPSLIICDEPTSALDVSVQAQILNLLRDLREELSVSYLFITHNMGVVDYLADKVAVMHAGQLVEFGDKNQVLLAPQHAYTKTLLSAVPRLKLFS